VFDEGQRDRLTTNIAGHLGEAADFIQERMIGVFKQVDPDYGQRVQDKIAALKVLRLLVLVLMLIAFFNN
jgi:catalase